MQTRSMRWIRAFAFGALLSGGCPSSQHATHNPVDAGDNASAQDAGAVYCPDAATTADTLAVGLSASGKTFTGKLVSASPTPPQLYNNNWVIDFVDASGSPASDLEVTKAATWMPYHNHGKPGQSMAMSDPGRFKITINLNMPGYFEIRLNVHSAAAGDDYIVFNYCLR